jgi:FAD/FMN-containing dehydrogenase
MQDLITIVQEAEGLGKRVRAVGSSWSFTDIAVTGDYLVETKQLNNVLTTVIGTALNATASGRQFVHVEVGMLVRDLCDYLDKHNLALTTMGGSDGQTIAGILSTCVHGPAGAGPRYGPRCSSCRTRRHAALGRARIRNYGPDRFAASAGYRPSQHPLRRPLLQCCHCIRRHTRHRLLCDSRGVTGSRSSTRSSRSSTRAS